MDISYRFNNGQMEHISNNRQTIKFDKLFIFMSLS